MNKIEDGIINLENATAAHLAEKAQQADLENTNNKVDGLETVKATKGEITKYDLDTSSDDKKISLNNLDDEARQAMAGNASVFTGLERNSVVEEYIAPRAVKHEKLDGNKTGKKLI